MKPVSFDYIKSLAGLMRFKVVRIVNVDRLTIIVDSANSLPVDSKEVVTILSPKKCKGDMLGTKYTHVVDYSNYTIANKIMWNEVGCLITKIEPKNAVITYDSYRKLIDAGYSVEFI